MDCPPKSVTVSKFSIWAGSIGSSKNGSGFAATFVTWTTAFSGPIRRELHDHLEACRDFLSLQLGLEFKPWPFINRVEHGIDFLGCRLLRGLLALNRRSRVRFRRKLAALEAAHTLGEIDELDLQQRATALVAFARSAGIRSWTFRRRVLEQILVSGLRPRTG